MVNLASRAVAAVRRRPELVAYALTSAATVVAGYRGNHAVQKVTKTAMMPALAVGVAKAPALPAHERALLLGGLAAACVGDWILIDPDQDRNLLNGAKSFSVMQLAYSTLLLTRGHRPTASVAAQRFGALPLGSALLHWKARPVARPLTGYGALLATTATLGGEPTTRVGLGGMVFTLSDGTIAIRRTLLSGTSAAWAEAFILATYATAQYLLVEGMSRPKQG